MKEYAGGSLASRISIANPRLPLGFMNSWGSGNLPAIGSLFTNNLTFIEVTLTPRLPHVFVDILLGDALDRIFILIGLWLSLVKILSWLH